MTGEQSRQLKVGDRVCWDRSTTDFGTVVDVAWNGVTIRWDDGHTIPIQHNDMARVERAPANLV
jgi:preprotein translocase subunit YajC